MNIRLCILALIAPAVAVAASGHADATIYEHAAEGGLAEVELGTLAQQKSSNPEVKEFGAMMVKDHTAANNELKLIAAAKGISLPSSPSAAQVALEAKLMALSGDSFDKSYVEGMIKDHQEDIQEFKQEAASGADAEAKAYATATLPTLHTHLAHIEAIAAEAGIRAK